MGNKVLYNSSEKSCRQRALLSACISGKEVRSFYKKVVVIWSRGQRMICSTLCSKLASSVPPIRALPSWLQQQHHQQLQTCLEHHRHHPGWCEWVLHADKEWSSKELMMLLLLHISFLKTSCEDSEQLDFWPGWWNSHCWCCVCCCCFWCSASQIQTWTVSFWIS